MRMKGKVKSREQTTQLRRLSFEKELIYSGIFRFPEPTYGFQKCP